MSALFKGRQSITLISEEPAFDAETGQRQFDKTWAGSKEAVFGFAVDLEADNTSYRVGNNGPVYFITARVPQNEPTQENLDRYEISTESASRPLLELPDIQADAEAYDAVGLNQDTYRKTLENFAEETHRIGETHFTNPSPELDRFQMMVRHVRAGVSGYEQDNVVLSRFRKIDRNYANAAGKFNLRSNQIIYTTAQLNLPADVAFSLNDLPSGTTNLTQDYRWGWKLRGMRVEIVGNSVEQTVQLLHAAWSLLPYSNATGNLAW